MRKVTISDLGPLAQATFAQEHQGAFQGFDLIASARPPPPPLLQADLKRARSLEVGLEFRFCMCHSPNHQIPSYSLGDLSLDPEHFARRPS